MILAHMLACDENALVCDFAETYHILNWRSLPARLAATLAAGFRPESRMMLKLSGAAAPMESLLLSIIADALRIMVWQNTRDGQTGKNPPQSIFERLSCAQGAESSAAGFDSAEDFMFWRESMLKGGGEYG